MKYTEKVEAANHKLLKNISFGAQNSWFYWYGILDKFPITKKGKVNLIIKTDDPSILMGIAVEHLKSVAGIVGIPNIFIDIVCQHQRTLRQTKKISNSGASYQRGINVELIQHTYLLLKATYHKVLQTGEE